MKNTLKYLMIAVVAILSSCENYNSDLGGVLPEGEVPVLGKYTIEAEIDNPGTRTTMGDFENGAYKVVWEENDAIALFNDGESGYAEYTLTSGAGKTMAKFGGSSHFFRPVAIYPYSIADGKEADNFFITLPQTQYSGKGSFGSGFNPMIGKYDEGLLHFMNLCGIIKVKLTGWHTVKSLTFTANDPAAKVSGPARVRFDNSGEPLIEMEQSASNSVTVKTGGITLRQDEATELYVVLPPQTFRGGFTLRIETETGAMTRSTNADIVLERSEIRALKTFELIVDEGLEISRSLEGEGTESSPLLIKSIEDLLLFRSAVNAVGGTIANGLGNNVSVEAFFRLENDIDLSPAYDGSHPSWVPVGNCDSDERLAFRGVFDGNGHKLTNLRIYSSEGNNHGLFGNVIGVVQNLEVRGSVKGNGNCGGIAAQSVGGIFISCVNRVEVEAISGNAGGIVGCPSWDLDQGLMYSVVYGCSNYGKIRSKDNAGGIAGDSVHSYLINCSNFGTISSDYTAGGIIGYSDISAVMNSANYGLVFSQGYCGGIVSHAESAYTFWSPTYSEFVNCVNFGVVANYSQQYAGISAAMYSLAYASYCYWLYDADNNLGVQEGFREAADGNITDCHAMTKAQITGNESFPEMLYKTDDGIPCYNILSSLNNFAYDQRSTGFELWGWELKEGDEWPTLTGKAAVKAGGDLDKLFEVYPRSLSVTFEPCTATVTVVTGVGYKISSTSSWIHEESVDTREENMVTTAVHTFSFDENPEYTERKGVIVFCNDKQECVNVDVTQSAKLDIDDMWKIKQFHHRSLGMKFTADWCQYCPAMAVQYDLAEQLNPYRLEVVAFHPTSSSLGFEGTGQLLDAYNVTGYPTGIVDGRKYAYGASNVTSVIDETEKYYETVSGMSFTSSLNGSEISVDLNLYFKKADDYKVTVLLVEDNIVGYQQSASDGSIKDFVHNNIARLALSDVLGDEIKSNDLSVWNCKYTGTVPVACNTDNLRVLVYVQKKFGTQTKMGNYGDWYVDNCRSEKVGVEAKLQFADDPGLDGFPASSDYSRDGELVCLQKATVGKGIDIIITGDAFADRDQTLFDAYAQRTMAAFFDVEPYTSLRDRFNVYRINAVSENGVVTDNARTKFSTRFGDGTLVEGDIDAITSFVSSRKPDVDLSKSIVIVLVNMQIYAGTCYYFADNSAVAFVPLQTSRTEFASTLRHEAAGHGFGKLADEYDGNGTVTNDWMQGQYYSMTCLPHGGFENIDLTSDANSVKWSRFISDGRYSGKVGVYEGGGTFNKGVWRPTLNSIMRYNNGYFNAPSREAIYKKIMTFSEGDSWSYDYETFVAFDETGKEQEASYKYSSSTFPGGAKSESEFVPLHPPVFLMR